MEVWSTSYSSWQSDRAGESDIVSSHDRGGGRGGEGDDDCEVVVNYNFRLNPQGKLLHTFDLCFTISYL